MTQISASVLNADFLKWKEWLPELELARVERIQWDLMDKRFVPNTGLDENLISQLRPSTKIFFETHIMALRPESYITRLSERGSEMAIFHVEACQNPLKIIRSIKDSGMKAGIAVNLKTGAEKLFAFLDKVDLALVMTVNAGFGGQKFDEKALGNVKMLRRRIDEEELDCKIEVDGGINAQTGRECMDAGADVLAAGTFIFNHPKGIVEAVKELRNT